MSSKFSITQLDDIPPVPCPCGLTRRAFATPDSPVATLARRFLLLLFGPLLIVSVFAQQGDRPGEIQKPLPEHIEVPPSPVLIAVEALETIQVVPGFRIEIVAADPLVHAPVAMAFGSDGRIWVVEMDGFMPNPDGVGEDARVGSIAVLEDTDGDGRMDKRTTFLGGLVLPRALALVDDGVLVAEPPHLWFCRDTNGDGVADEKTEVDSNYGGTSNPEHTANGLLWALDNWIYNANLTARYRYEGRGQFTREITITRGQWGISQDDTGRLFYNSNSDPLRADLVPAEYFRRNPFLSAPSGANVRVAPADLRIWPGRPTPGVNRGYHSLNEEGKITQVTAACAPVVYRGALFPAEIYGDAFICEPAGNLVKRIALTERDGELIGRNAYEGTEFITSTDERFRPVNLVTGPDGALYVVDMYRGIIQHRIYLTSFLRQQVEERGLSEGLGMGRIYRVVPEGATPPKARFNLSRESTAQLVSRLQADNNWWRDTAQRLLVERRDPAAVTLLRKLARSRESPPLGRLHALWTLEGMDELDRETVLAALSAGDERVRAAGIRLSETWLAEPNDTEIFKHVTAAGNDSSTRLVLQAALSLGEARSPAALPVLATIAERHGRQSFVLDAIVSGLAGREVDFVNALLVRPEADNAARAVALAASAVLKSRDAVQITLLLSNLSPDSARPAWARAAVLDGILRFVPKTPEGTPVPGMIAVEPRALLLLAKETGTPEGRRAAELAALLKWPGKPGLEEELAAIAARLKPEQKVHFEKGRETFAAICAACHQPNGEGLDGLAPQLQYSRYVLGDERNLARIVLSGKEKNGMIMPPLHVLDDETIASILTYIRQSWGHDKPPVAPAVVAAVRRESAGREEPWSDEELSDLAK